MNLMQERIVENWLDRASERSFQVPFCSVLTNKGYTVVHMSRHCGMEMGKDILAIDNNGRVCAFQLKNVKGKKLSLSAWRDDLGKQINSLALGKVIHPAINTNEPHKPFIVINGEIDEEVAREIDDFNRMLDETMRSESKLTVIVKGQLLKDFKELSINIWPNELNNTKEFLEIFLSDGKGMLDKEKFSKLIENTYTSSKLKKSNNEYLRLFSSAALITASSIIDFTLNENHFAEIEAWTIYLAYTSMMAEKFNINFSLYENEFRIGYTAIYNSLYRLCDELMCKDIIAKSNHGLGEIPLFRAKMTLLVGLMSLYALWRRMEEKEENEHDVFLRDFIKRYSKKVIFWGEYCFPQILILYFYNNICNVSIRNDFFVKILLDNVIFLNKETNNNFLPNPYYDIDSIYPKLLNIDKTEIKDTFKKSSYTIESLLHLFVRTGLKQTLKLEWSNITKISFITFKHVEKWQMYTWRSNYGYYETKIMPFTMEWSKLLEEARESNGSELPDNFQKFPFFYICFLIVFPHRLSSSGTRWLYYKLNSITLNY